MILSEGETEGYYTIAEASVIDLGEMQACYLDPQVSLTANDPTSSFDDVPDVDALPSWDGTFTGIISGLVQVLLSDADGNWESTWRDFVPGTYYSRKFRFRIKLTTTDATIVPILESWIITIDMPDKVELYTDQTIEDTGTEITFSRIFQAKPNVQVTIINGVSGDTVDRTYTQDGEGRYTGVTIEILNGGSGVERTVNVAIQGY